MVVKLNNMEKQVRSELKGGKGDIHFLNCVSKDTIPNCRLLSYMTIPPEGSIGEHEHVEETECYVIKSGSCGSRVHIVLKGKLYKFYKKLDDVEKEISVNYSIPFIRIHKSYLVNFQQIRKVGYTEVETKDGRILNISDTYKKDVRARYSKLLWDGDV